MAKFTDRTGEKGVSNEGYSMEIVAYRGFCDVDILIDGKHIVTGRTYNSFKKGEISNPYHRSVVGIGYYGVGKYRLCKGNEFERKIYGVWRGMLNRCYMLERKSYAECTVDERFHNFQVFAAWYEENFYTVGTERMDIDKDILIKGNKVYSPDACILVPVTINTLFIQNRRHRGALPVGVYKFRNKYRACVSRYDSSIDLGTFDTPEEAFLAYKTAKEAYIKQVADEYKDKIPKKLYDALYAYTIEITD